MKKIKQRLADISIRKKMIFITVVAGVLPIAIMILLYTFDIKAEYDIRQKNDLDTLASLTDLNTKNVFMSIDGIIDQYASNEILQTSLNTPRGTLVEDHLKRISNLIGTQVDTRDIIHDMVLYYASDAIVYEFDKVKSAEGIRQETWYQAFSENPSITHIFTTLESGKSYVHILRKVNSSGFDKTDLIMVTIDGDALSNQWLSKLQKELKVEILLIDPENKIIQGNKDRYDTETDFAKFSIEDYQDYDIFQEAFDIEYYIEGWSFFFIMPKDLYQAKFISQVSLIVVSILLITFVLVFLSYLLSQNITTRLRQLSQVMNHSDIDHLTVIEESGHDEIGQTILIFNTMVERIKNLILALKLEKEKTDQLLVEKSIAYDEIHLSLEKIKDQNRQIHDLVYQDSLTGLANRTAITEHISNLTQKGDRQLAILFFDIDNFKFINDTYGHEVGDQVIQATADLLKKHNTQDTLIGRFGGDEFIIVYDALESPEEIKAFTEAIQEDFRKPILIDHKKFYLTNSIGIAISPEHGDTFVELIKRADMALYSAKESGKNTAVLFREDLQVDVEERHNFQNAIKEAFANHEFYLNYQPIYDSDDLNPSGFEALIRWKSPTYGQVNPLKLITHAESMGLIIDLGEWIVTEACHFAQQIAMNYDQKIHVAINISMIQLMSHDFAKRMLDIVESFDLSTDRIVFEMTETVLIESIEQCKETIDDLKRYGFSISLDDFGTGYSSLNYLKELPVDILKIDKAFVSTLCDHQTDADFIKLIADIAHNRNMVVVAEGVEEEEQVKILTRLGVDHLQGYYFNKALPEAKAFMLLNEERSS